MNASCQRFCVIFRAKVRLLGRKRERECYSLLLKGKIFYPGERTTENVWRLTFVHRNIPAILVVAGCGTPTEFEDVTGRTVQSFSVTFFSPFFFLSFVLLLFKCLCQVENCEAMEGCADILPLLSLSLRLLFLSLRR